MTPITVSWRGYARNSRAKLVVIPGMGHDLPRGAWTDIIDAITANAERAKLEARTAEPADGLDRPSLDRRSRPAQRRAAELRQRGSNLAIGGWMSAHAAVAGVDLHAARGRIEAGAPVDDPVTARIDGDEPDPLRKVAARSALAFSQQSPHRHEALKNPGVPRVPSSPTM